MQGGAEHSCLVRLRGVTGASERRALQTSPCLLRTVGGALKGAWPLRPRRP